MASKLNPNVMRDAAHHTISKGWPSYDTMRYCGETLYWAMEMGNYRSEVRAKISPDGEPEVRITRYYRKQIDKGSWSLHMTETFPVEFRYDGIERLRLMFEMNTRYEVLRLFR